MTTRLAFHGAAGTVTGSCFLVEGKARVLIDCGMFQGSKTEKELNYRPFPFEARSIDALLLTHAHIDHSGLVPKLVKDGFTGPIFATGATADLCSVMLPDSAHIQELEVEILNRRNRRRGRQAVEPIYGFAEAHAAQELFQPVDYERWVTLPGGMRARFWNAGHLLGSASIELEVPGEGTEPMRLLFSGDIGPDAKLLHPDPAAPAGFDYVVCEATYGGTDRGKTSPEARRQALRNEVRAAIRPKGALIIPAFAVERTQELLADLASLMASGEIPAFPVFIDSPLAAKATAVFQRHASELEQGDVLLSALQSPQVRFTETADESKALDGRDEFHAIIAASGMCEAGRIRHRLRNWLWREEATVLMVGFQAEGTLGRILLDGATTVRIQGDEVKVRARIRAIDIYSGHADGPELAAWLRARLPVRNDIFLVHGEPPALDGLRARTAPFHPADRVVIPRIDDVFSLTPDGARPLAVAPPRISPHQVARRDWHNDLARLVLDIGAAVDGAADERAKAVVIRRVRRALEGDGGD